MFLASKFGIKLEPGNPPKRSIDAACWPKVLDSRMPLTLSVSSVAAVMSASDFCVSVEAARRTLPTRLAMNAKTGSIASDRIVRRLSMKSMAMIVLMTTATLLVMLAAVSVTTACTPPTSLARRLWISPVRVSVKKRSGIAWRWA